jgi:diguanylate cyclase (GGDEF)-like protein
MNANEGTALSRTLASTMTLRLAGLHAVDGLYTPIEERFERLTRIGRDALRVRVVGISIFADQQQWFKSILGWRINSLPFDSSLCVQVLNEQDVAVECDMPRNPVLANHALVAASPGFKFYAGVPLKNKDGMVIGTFCALDTKPKEFGPEQIYCLKSLGALAERELLSGSLITAHGALAGKLSAARRQALVDPLTRVWNRRGSELMLPRILAKTAATGVRVAVCALDLDKLKPINDRYGHKAGDDALVLVARCLTASIRPDDLVFRTGGDEFLLLINNVTELQLSDFADRLKERLGETPLRAAGVLIRLNVSIGAVICESAEPASLDQVLDAADAALYRCKKNPTIAIEVTNAVG